MKKLFTFAIVACMGLFTFTSCETANEILPGLSDGEIAEGLKSALVVGTDSSVNLLNAPGGYLNDAAVKILFPEDAQKTLEAAQGVPVVGGAVSTLMTAALTKMNSAAEEAAVEAAPIFKEAITGMTITDAKDILFGADNAATSYLSNATRGGLVGLYAPKIAKSIESVGLNTAWDAVTEKVNPLLNLPIGGITGVKPLPTDLSAHITEKALDGLFLKVQDKEKDIRKNANERVNDVLKKVFGELDK